MGDKSITKVQSKHSPRGEMGQKYLASGLHVAMRLWDKEQPGKPEPPTVRAYETVGYVIGGRAELHLEDQKILLEPGDCWTVPPGSTHSYHILEPFTAVEATSPPAFVEGRDRPMTGKGARTAEKLLPPGMEGRDSGEPGSGQGRADVTGKMPGDIRVDPNLTEGHRGYEESGDSEIISRQRVTTDKAEDGARSASEWKTASPTSP